MLCLEKNNYCQRYNKEGRIIICCCIQGPKELFRPFKMRPRCNRRQKGKVQIIAELVDLCHFTWNSEKQRWEHWAGKMPGTLPGVARGQVKLSGAALQGSTQHCPFRGSKAPAPCAKGSTPCRALGEGLEAWEETQPSPGHQQHEVQEMLCWQQGHWEAALRAPMPARGFCSFPAGWQAAPQHCSSVWSCWVGSYRYQLKFVSGQGMYFQATEVNTCKADNEYIPTQIPTAISWGILGSCSCFQFVQ